ncbi:MAG TPA: hypothetical protein VFD55_01300 [Candidatus Angelobacter sp.]|nr:hypothetical protein [Candidatus Angelobacter sp.]
MKIKQTILVFALLLGIGSFLFVPTASAEICNPGTDYEYETSVIPCSTDGRSGIDGLLKLVINILTAGIGIAAVGGIVYGSILYASAADSSEQVKKAISIIFNVVVGLLAYALMYAFLNFIIPGGLFT